MTTEEVYARVGDLRKGDTFTLKCRVEGISIEGGLVDVRMSTDSPCSVVTFASSDYPMTVTRAIPNEVALWRAAEAMAEAFSPGLWRVETSSGKFRYFVMARAAFGAFEEGVK